MVGNVTLNLKKKKILNSMILLNVSLRQTSHGAIIPRLFLFLLPGQKLEQGQAYKREGALLLVDSSEWKEGEVGWDDRRIGHVHQPRKYVHA